jgi:predicted AAA+ superfamily ATPase
MVIPSGTYDIVIKRNYWHQIIENALRQRSVLWLAGVRRAGKTTLCRTLDKIEYFDCELPRHRLSMEDPEAFFSSLKGKRIVLDEVHRLPNPSETLKIAADHFPDVKVIATGSSTLTASAKFKDTLTGRKNSIWVTPMMSYDLGAFKAEGLERRFIRGGLPPFYLAQEYPEKAFQEWVDDYWAKDVLQLYRLELKESFERFMELLWSQSGGLFEATKFAKLCEVNRKTITNYLGILEETGVVSVIRPFSGHGPTEIVSAPKVYGFDTGFVCCYKGWTSLRRDDLGLLWEHYVLNEMQARLQTRKIHYWRDKRGKEVDFVWCPPGKNPIAIECKWSIEQVDLSGLDAFSSLHPGGRRFVVSPSVERPIKRKTRGGETEFLGLEHLVQRLGGEVLV